MERSRRIATPVGLLEVTAADEAVTAIRFVAGATNETRGAAAACLCGASARPAADGIANDEPPANGIDAGDPGEESRDPEGKTGTDSGAGPMENSVLGSTADPAEVLLRRAARELEQYFAGTRREFTFPVAPAGTPFQQAVWAALRTIPCGETRTYGQIAAQIGRPKACRAVGMANNRNPVAIAIPCHRVVGSGGGLTGYAGGLDIKAFLLELEARPQRGENTIEAHG